MPKKANNTKLFNVRPDDLKSVIKGKKGPTVVMFGASWCPACKEFKPILEESLQVLSKMESNIKVRYIDADKHQDIMEKAKLDIPGYPTVMAYGLKGSKKSVEVPKAPNGKFMAFNIIGTITGDFVKSQENLVSQAQKSNPGFKQRKLSAPRKNSCKSKQQSTRY